MNRTLIVLGGLILILMGLFLSFKGFYNKSVEYEENVKTRWADVEVSLQRRGDLIGNLVETVKGSANFEKETLQSVIQARANATAITIDPSKATPEQLEQFQNAQSNLNSSLSRLMVSVERYPELKSNQNFLNLQTELTSTENNINIVRNRFNDEVKVFNTYIKKFPNSLWNSIGPKHNTIEYFKADEIAKEVPKVKF